MAEDQEKEAELSNEEAEEVERLLEGDDGEEAGGTPGLKGKLEKNFFSNKKLLMIIGGVIFFLIICVVFFFMQGSEETTEVTLDEQVVEEEVKEEEVKEEEEVKVAKVNIYKLEPFFLPLLDDGKETGQFISVSANLLLSNSVLYRDLDKILPLLRKSIYNIFREKRPADFTLKRSNTEERIKKEILTASNSLLLSGTGTITDIYFSRFMIK
jgi:flagellar basal body-associated protein FliL